MLQNFDSPLDFEVTIAEVSWLGGSMIVLGSLCTNLTIALLLERAGRMFCISLLAVPFACLWILVYFASNVVYLYAARFLCGFTGALIGHLAANLANRMLPERAPYLLKRSQLSAAEKSFGFYKNPTDQKAQLRSKSGFEELRMAVLSLQCQNSEPLSYKDLL
ncbi:blast:Facilitated trehalose transporter Tret1 [Drosophila guanche]|uniref:Blast:Facilitated trehalose transporter Tret1 n=1 Tax=Drosophila guanche TaxID=7266 RepID=A0A3B0JP05_DROGU|nr:blast:Facilitated trehalose transporter Tret1 [Drosophila guanche]